MMLSAPLLIGAGAPSPSVDVSLTGLRNTHGNVLACLTANAAHFPDCGKDPRAVKISVKASAAGHFSMEAPASGTYAIAIIHDENANNKMDMRLFMPREGFGFSNNPKIRMGPPKFKSAQFGVSGTAHQSIVMKYML